MNFFFFNDTATTEIYTLSLHDALPISMRKTTCSSLRDANRFSMPGISATHGAHPVDQKFRKRSEEHTSELQSQSNLVCRLLLEKKKYHHASTLSCGQIPLHAVVAIRA